MIFLFVTRDSQNVSHEPQENSKDFFASKLSVINVTMAYTMYKKPVTRPYTLETSGNLPVHSDILRVYRKITGVFRLQ